MYLDNAIQRIDAINWDAVGSNPSRIDADLGYEFLRRLAQFFKEQSIKPVPPLHVNIARLLGDAEEVNISDYCNSESSKFLSKYIYRKNIHVLYTFIKVCRKKSRCNTLFKCI